MAKKVYAFHITYEGLEDRIWRKIEKYKENRKKCPAKSM